MSRQAPQGGRRNEHGSILVLSAVGMVVAIICASLAIDLGFLAHEARVDQKVADLAALDGLRALPANPTSTAEASATRNGFPFASPDYSLLVKWGPSKTGPWSLLASDLAAATAIQVSAKAPHTSFFPFVPGGQTTTRTAVASRTSKAQFSVGSDLANIDTGASSIANLNKITTAILGTSTAVNLTAVGYQGLAGGTVSLADLIAADSTLGTPSTLLTNSTSVRKLALASVSALNTKATGPPADAVALAAKTPLATFAGSIGLGVTAKLGDILDFSAPADSSAMAAQINVFDLITSAGELSIENGTHFVTVPGLTVGVPGLTSSTLTLTVIEAPKLSNYGPAEKDATTGKWVTTAHTAQIDLKLDNQINVAVPPVCVVVCAASALSVSLGLPITIAGAEATGSLTAIRCTTPKQNDIEVVTAGTHAITDSTLAVSLLGIPLPLPPLVHTDVSLVGGTSTLTFTGPTYPTAIQSTAATGAGLSTATTSQFTVLGADLGAVTALLKPVTDDIDKRIFGPIFKALGLSVGGADVVTMRVDCGVPGLAS
ncbi:MAG: hypothetical protein M3137_18125 [Actinomycetota bacterium]|nr:hypothetical protein [Actinomycetota bacterium]